MDTSPDPLCFPSAQARELASRLEQAQTARVQTLDTAAASALHKQVEDVQQRLRSESEERASAQARVAEAEARLADAEERAAAAEKLVAEARALARSSGEAREEVARKRAEEAEERLKEVRKRAERLSIIQACDEGFSSDALRASITS